ncbi:fumarylacetoacetate hydrolase family protein [Microbacterium sp.]|uniref:fumarylacetoacetate hydrolase family protein n=1 Tax=Microbacterium sp. TaxID=51671 RepID=UPI003A8FF7D6
MKLVTFRENDDWIAGAVINDNIYRLSAALVNDPDAGDVTTVRALLDGNGHRLGEIAQLVEAAVQDGLAPSTTFAEAALNAPVPNPAKVLCIGLNYSDHVTETGRALPQYPDVFPKFATSMVGPRDPIGGRDVTDQLDFEGELAIVIGRTAKNVSEDDALDYVAGATVLNDITARDLQYRGTQWLMGKAVDASTPSGPALVTLDEVGDIQDLDITTHVNGERMQGSNTKNMIFPIRTIVSYLSRTITLEPGDIIATGTPEGIGAKRTPPVWLQAGDEVTVSLSRVGVLSSIVG